MNERKEEHEQIRVKLSVRFIQKMSEAAQEGSLLLLLTKEEASQLATNSRFSAIAPPILREIERLVNRSLFSGQNGSCALVPTLGLMPYEAVVLGGLGEGQRMDWRRAGAEGVRKALENGCRTLSVALEYNEQRSFMEQLYALAEGLLLGSYCPPTFAKTSSKLNDLAKAIIYVSGNPDDAARAEMQQIVERASIFVEATSYARSLTNRPGNLLTPSGLAAEASALAEKYKMPCTILDEQAICAHQMGGLAAVGQGSIHPPRMIAIHYDGTGGKAKDIIGLVGKGITFDTGGISLKKADGMEEMISDMGGAAVVLALVHVLGRLKPKIRVVIVIPAAENMPSGAAYKPGDIITVMDGQTIEVLNTDAEGRVVLADGLLYARQLGATKLIDVATLTGAVLVSLADIATGAVANDEALLAEVLAAADAAGERLWAFPSYPEYREMLASKVADIRNSATKGRWAGAITGGWFIGHFAGDLPWVHLDIGGTAWLWEEQGIEPRGATGVMVRTLAHFLCGSYH